MRWVLGFCLGTALSAAFAGVLIWANGVGPPPLTDWRAVAAYPTGSMATTLEAMAIFYFLSFTFVFVLAWTGRRAAWLWRKVRGSRPRTQDRQPTPGR